MAYGGAILEREYKFCEENDNSQSEQCENIKNQIVVFEEKNTMDNAIRNEIENL